MLSEPAMAVWLLGAEVFAGAFGSGVMVEDWLLLVVEVLEVLVTALGSQLVEVVELGVVLLAVPLFEAQGVVAVGVVVWLDGVVVVVPD